MAYRTRKQNNLYIKNLNTVHKITICVFCDINQSSPQFVESGNYFKIIYNIFPYSFWDYHKVTDHLMIVPLKHTDTIKDLNSEEAQEFVSLLGKYEHRGYNIYARAPKSNSKTVIHQHTHLIKISKKSYKFLLYLKRPYIRIVR